VEPKRATLDEPKRQTLDDELGLISEADYAAFIGKTLASVRNERSAGRGPPFVRLTRTTIKYHLAAVKALVQSRTVTPLAEPTMIDARPLRRRARRQSAA
jgi:hypothetical protein